MYSADACLMGARATRLSGAKRRTSNDCHGNCFSLLGGVVPIRAACLCCWNTYVCMPGVEGFGRGSRWAKRLTGLRLWGLGEMAAKTGSNGEMVDVLTGVLVGDDHNKE